MAVLAWKRGERRRSAILGVRGPGGLAFALMRWARRCWELEGGVLTTTSWTVVTVGTLRALAGGTEAGVGEGGSTTVSTIGTLRAGTGMMGGDVGGDGLSSHQVTVGTLRGGTGTLGTGTVSGGEAGAMLTALGVGVTLAWRISMRSLSACEWLSVNGDKGELVLTMLSAVWISVTAARIMSIGEACGMIVLVGNHVTVSQIRSARVSQIQTL